MKQASTNIEFCKFAEAAEEAVIEICIVLD